MCHASRWGIPRCWPTWTSEPPQPPIPPTPPAPSPHRRHGYAVCANVLSADEVSTAMGMIWDHNEGMGTGVDRHDVRTWDDARWVENAAEHNGRATFGLGLPHSEALWFIRGVPAVKRVW